MLVSEPKGNHSIVRIVDDWYIVARSVELKDAPLAVTLYNTPLVLYRDGDGVPSALLDRCAHRNVPLSLGRRREGRIECPYHGWQFDGQGVCKVVPSLCGEPEGKARRVPSFACKELDGFVWVYATPDVTPVREPFRMPLLGEKGYTTVQESVEAPGTIHAVAENALDVPHTAFLHRGLFRNEKKDRNKIRAVIRRSHDRVEAEYIGEPRPTGIAAKILAPQGGPVEHFDRFILPSITQVEYKLQKTHFLVTAALTPVTDTKTKLFASISFSLPLPGWTIESALRPIALRIFGQDSQMLTRQRETIERFGGEQYVSTEIDTLGPHILRLLKNAERGDRAPGEVVVREVELLV